MHRRFCRWRDKGVWEGLLEELISEPDFEWLMIDASHIKVHPHAAGAEGGNQDMGRTKGGSIARYTWPWMRMVCRSEYLLQAGITAMIVSLVVFWSEQQVLRLANNLILLSSVNRQRPLQLCE